MPRETRPWFNKNQCDLPLFQLIFGAVLLPGTMSDVHSQCRGPISSRGSVTFGETRSSLIMKCRSANAIKHKLLYHSTFSYWLPSERTLVVLVCDVIVINRLLKYTLVRFWYGISIIIRLSTLWSGFGL